MLPSGWRIQGIYCLTPVANMPHPTWEYSLRSDRDQPLFRQEFAPGMSDYIVRYWFVSEQWTRQRIDRSLEPEVCWRESLDTDCEWVTVDVHRQLLAQRAEIAGLTDQAVVLEEQSQQDAAVASRDEAERLRNLAELRSIEMGSLFLQPACNSSINGCR